MQFFYNGTLLDIDEESTIALTFVANDLQKPESVQSSYSNTISIPATTKNKHTLGYAHVLNSTGQIPYRVGDVTVIAPDGRELFPFGKGEVQRFIVEPDGKRRFEIFLTAGNLDVFAALGDKSIQELDFSLYNHSWDMFNIATASVNNNVYSYPLLYRGKFLDLTNINIWDMYPAVFGKVILDKIMSENGFTYTGLDTELMRRLEIPAVEKYEFTELETKAHSMRAGLIAGRTTERRKGEFTEVVKFESTTEPTYYAGESVVFTPENWTFIAPRNMRVNVNVGLQVHLHMNDLRSFDAQLAGRVDIMHNGKSLANTEIKTKDDIRQVVTVAQDNLFLKQGDYLYVTYKFRKLGTNASGYSELYNRDSKFGPYADYFEVRMLPEFPHGGTVELNKWLPDIKQKDFLKFCLQLHAGMMQTDQYTNTVRFNVFQEVEQNTLQARDWTGKFIPETEDLSYKFGDFAQKNYIKWKEDETVKKGYGNGIISIDNQNLEIDKTIIEFPFAATQAGGSFALPALLTYKEREGTAAAEYETQDIEPRALLLSDDLLTYTLGEHVESGYIEYHVNYIVVGYDEVKYDNNTYKNGDTIEGGVVPTYEVIRGKGYIYKADTFRTVTANRLYFDGRAVSLNVPEYILPTYYRTLQSILQQSKYLKLQLNLKPVDVQEFDFSIPVWLGNQYQQYFYVNKINEFIPNQPTEVELARL